MDSLVTADRQFKFDTKVIIYKIQTEQDTQDTFKKIYSDGMMNKD